MSEFKRERKYIVFKIKDVEQLDTHQQNVLNNLCEAIQDIRQISGKPELECVVVENDWHEYETVWQMIEARVKKEVNQ